MWISNDEYSSYFIRLNYIFLKAMLKQLYVSMGSATPSQTESWVSQAQIAHTIQPTYAHATRPTSAIQSLRRRPLSSQTSAKSRIRSAGVTRQRPDSGITENTDSGFWSRTENESNTENMSLDIREEDEGSIKNTPSAPRPSYDVCCFSKNVSSNNCTIYNEPSADDDGISSDVDMDDSLTSFSDQDEFASAVVATVLKYALADISNTSPEKMKSHPAVITACPDVKYLNLTKSHIEKIGDPSIVSEKSNKSPVRFAESETVIKEKSENKPIEKFTTLTPAIPETVQSDDDEALLNSDDDYEGQRDSFFLKNKKKTESLLKKTGMDKFKEFLVGTKGEINWNLWIDIDCARLIKDASKLAT